MALIRTLVDLTIVVVTFPIRALVFTFNQFRAALGEFGKLFSDTSTEEVVPPTVLSTLEFLGTQASNAAGTGSPQEQLTGSVVIGALLIVVSGGVLTPLAVFLLIPFGVGLLRLFPVVENLLWRNVQRAGSSSMERLPSDTDVQIWERK
jgi:hypothetical protein